MKKSGSFLTSTVALFTGLAIAVPLSLSPTPSLAKADGIIGFGVGVLVGIGLSKGSKKARGNKYRNKRKRPHQRAGVRTKKRQQVRQIQTALSTLGYYRTKVDGISGRGTRRAISKFQLANGFRATGRLNAEQKSMLFASVGINTPYNQAPAYGNPNGNNYANRNGEVDVFGGQASDPVATRQPAGLNGETTIFGNEGSQPVPDAPVPVEKKKPAPVFDSNELATVFDEQQPPDDSQEVVDSEN